MGFRPSLGALALFLCVLLLPAGAALAQGNCIELGGRKFCGAQQGEPWTVDHCDEAASFTSRRIAWCNADGGTWNGSTCIGATPTTDDNASSRAVQFTQNMHPTTICSLASDTGYHATFDSYWCLAGRDEYVQGQLSRTSRRIVVPCADGTNETIAVYKQRAFSCPAGYTLENQPWYGYMCSIPIENCATCNGVGDSVLPATGVQVQEYTDYRHPSGLEFTRYYHSLQFLEPYTTSNGSHSDMRMGRAWRTNFDKRLMPLTPQTQLNNLRYGLALPNGEVQYFDLNGVEQWNIGPSGTLVTVAGTGWYYKAPDRTEFYGTDGRLRTITLHSGLVLTLTYSDGTSGPNGGYALDAAGNPTSVVLGPNLLIRVTDSYGNTLGLGYNVGERLVKVTDPAGGVYRYAYDPSDNLVSVTFPDQQQILYRYNEPANMNGASAASALTSIVDENGTVFATLKYDASGRSVSAEHAGGAGRVLLSYNVDGTRTLTDPLSTARTFSFSSSDGVGRFTGSSLQGGAGFGAGVKAQTFDSAGNRASQTDFNDVKTCYAYLAGRNLETVRVEGLPAVTACSAVLPDGAALPAGSRKIVTEWHGRWSLPTRISEPGRRTTLSYHGDAGASCAPADALIAEGGPTGVPIAVVCSKTVQATTDLADGGLGFAATVTGTARTWAYTYDARGKVLTADGPRIDAADTTTYAYYAPDDPDPAKRGNVASITDAAAHVTSITAYNAHGQPLTIVDPNGLATTLAYDARRRLISRTAGTEVTTYDYDFAGLLKKVTLPDGSFLSYSYDGAHRLSGLQDKLGNSITYTLDAMGNRTHEEVRDPASALAQTRSRVYNSLNRLFQELGAQNQTTQYAYDNNGNLVTVTDPLQHATSNEYDSLNRLKKATDANQGVTQYVHNGQDALTQVTDPRSFATSYTVDGLGNLTLQSSPDTGNTSNTYDAAGNLLTQTDAKGQTTTYAYDALNRVTLISFHDGSKQAYAYDQGPNGLGRLSSISETNPSSQVTSVTAYAYDPHGRVASDTRTLNGLQYVVGYRYDSSGRLDRLSYPSGRSVEYSFDALGRISALSTTPAGGAAQSLASAITYHPFGGVKSYTLGNGQLYTRSYDQDGRIATYTLGGTEYGLGYDAASRIEFIAQTGLPANSNSYGYDVLDRLTSAVTPGTSYSYGYDAVGNRLSKTVGAGTDAYAYSATSNRIASITPASGPVRSFVFDANGSTTADGNNSYAYDSRGRLVQATSTVGTSTYQVNALGQRVRKTNSSGDVVYTYDGQGHPIAEGTAAGALIKEYVWLGDMPLALIVASGSYFIHVDQLNTPRLVANAAGTTVWKWDQQEPFGNNVADENPSGLGVFDLPLRLPGQYFDKETNLHYNYYRDYDPSLGRYGESDPIGLIGGLNTYAYVAGGPLHASDELGLFYGNEAAYATRVPVAGPAAAVAGAFLGGVAIGTAIYNEYGEQIQDALEKICRPDKSSDHRGRIQAQGNTTGPDVNVSSAWAQKYPLTKAEGFAHLHRTVIQIPPRQLPRFTNAISKAASFIQSTSTQSAPFDKSFYQNWRQSARRGAERIDIQIFSGEAF